MKCVKCGMVINENDEYMEFGGSKIICMPCVEKMEALPERCPVCGTETDKGDESVALLLTRATATPQERLSAHSALVHVCPKCHTLYFDDFQYALLETLKDTK